MRERYLNDPCGTASIPYWKAASISVPESMRLLHEREFRPEMLEQYSDEPYFRLKHDLQDLKPAVIPNGFSLRAASPAQFAAHINSCYIGIGVTAEEVQGYAERKVYCADLWIAIQDDKTGKTAATGIADLDREIGEGILEWIQVSEEYRSHGLGTFIVSELLWRMKDTAKFATVSGQCSNPADPEALYRKCGFTGSDVWHILRRHE